MKKGYQLVISFILLCALSAQAFAIAPQENLSESDRNTLREMGFTDGIIDVMPQSDIDSHLAAYRTDPSKISVQTTTLSVNPLEDLKAYLNMSYAEKAAAGMSLEDVERMDAAISELRTMTNEELINQTGLPEDEVALYRSVLDGNTNVVPYGEGDITPSELDFSLVVYDTSDAEGADYSIFIYWNWLNFYWTLSYDDKVGLAWGGNLTQTAVSEYVSYYSYSGGAWTDLYETENHIAYNEVEINGSGYYYFPQAHENHEQNGNSAKSGRISCTLSQNGIQGYTTKVIAQYGHQINAIVGTGISIDVEGVSASLDFGIGYDTCEQQSEIITY